MSNKGGITGVSPSGAGERTVAGDSSMNGLRMLQAYRGGANAGQLGAMNQPAQRQQQFLPPALAPYMAPAPAPTPYEAMLQQRAAQSASPIKTFNLNDPSTYGNRFNPQDTGGM
jgi:hypothetical protein